jgi:Glyoxalase-like domain
MARLKQIVVDCHHPADLARFWAAALDDFEVRVNDDAETDRLAALCYTPETEPFVILDGLHLEICFQKVDPPPVAKKPLHLDMRTDDRAREVRRLEDLGASVRGRFEAHTWMRDPEGNDFCLVDT